MSSSDLSPVPFTAPHDRTPAQQFANAFGRLRAMLRGKPVPIVDVHAQARECGRRAYAAGMRLDVLVDALAGVVPEEAYGRSSMPTEIIDAGVEAYLVAAESQPGVGVA